MRPVLGALPRARVVLTNSAKAGSVFTNVPRFMESSCLFERLFLHTSPHKMFHVSNRD
jgi:hypothetical protein